MTNYTSKGDRMTDLKTAHTPGPWKLTRTRRYGVNAIGAPWICDVTKRPELEANARLIAAAPAMLKVLIAFVRIATSQGLNLGPLIADAEAAITLATGALASEPMPSPREAKPLPSVEDVARAIREAMYTDPRESIDYYMPGAKAALALIRGEGE